MIPRFTQIPSFKIQKIENSFFEVPTYLVYREVRLKKGKEKKLLVSNNNDLARAKVFIHHYQG